MTFKINEIDDYMNKITDTQAKELIVHCNEFGIRPEICAWYDDMNDFYYDWVDHVGYTEEQAEERFEQGKDIGEFKVFENGEIVRLVY